ncbi:Helicase conserved C-terminal domain-containing protein [Paenibacillus tianmuensis]|uniref:Helicase conserved C-terminal domain-containing protein n=1 Tax=Paenibacillus tianmuensis TaxID=624147 RepID=A0A1G4PMI8_9BACL|nr:SNF2-related protein [Paenibacillus tianmuensis]SCW33405.1 Helicase conserved C-terminal domain-containing protein [Paenibacillus tianmuensis]
MQSTERKEHVRQLNEHVQLYFERDWFEELHDRAQRNGPWDDWMMFRLAEEAEQSGLIRSFDELQCLSHLPNLVPMDHQIDTAKKVLTEMRGRAILADEVGLGKTIEAGLILKEYMIRGLVRKALILVPASLVLQWVRELNQKFGISAVAQKKEYMWAANDVVVASMDTAKRDPHRDIVLGLEYDMLIVDEAHKLKNKKTTNYQFINELRKKYCLLLTATPVQNDLKELYNLITLLKPGQLGGQGSFQANFVVDKRIPKNEEQLQHELSKVMIRNRRSDGNVNFTKRIVRNIPLQLSSEEQALYDGVTHFVRGRYEESGGDIGSILSLVTLQREVCSSRDAVFITLVNLFKKTEENSPLRAKIWELVELIRSIKANTKAEKVMELIGNIGEKVIIFTEYRASQEYLLHYLKERKISAVPYRGGMNRGKKDWMMDLFRNRAQVLIATEAGGEGINLQFCHHMINFDLPWNPMRVEQRIGRVHRLGQQEDVKIYNLSTLGTIEEHILSLLHEKINMFELVIGELDTILERFEKKTSLESHLAKLILSSRSQEDIRQQLDELGQSFTVVRSEVEYESQENTRLQSVLNAVGRLTPGQDHGGEEARL